MLAPSQKILLSLFIFWLGLSFIEPSYAKEDASIFYSKGMVHFSEGEYTQALKFFKKVYQLNSEDENNLHLLGLTHIQLKNFSQASKFLAKLLEKNPNFGPAYLAYGLSLFEQGQFAKALPWFEKVVKVFPKEENAKTAQEFITQIKAPKPTPPEKPETAKRWALNASSSFYYDSNVTRDPDNQDLAGFADQDDYLASGALDFRYLLLNGEKTKFYFDYEGYQSVYFNVNLDSNRFNYGRNKGGVDLVYKMNDQIQWRFPVHYSFISLGKAKYLQNINGKNIFDWLWQENWLLSITTGLRRDLFFQSTTNAAQNRDATQPYVRLEQYFFLPQNRDIYFKAGYEFEKNLATGGDWEFETHHGLYAIHLPLVWKVDFLILGDVVVKRNFKNTDSVFNARRQDSSIYNTVVLSRKILPFLKVSGTYAFFIQDSSLNRYTYRREVAGLTFSTEL